jgi:DNA repair protein RadA
MTSVELNLEDIHGIGPTSAGKLRDVGIDSVEALAVCTANDLADIINCSKETASTMIIQAMKKLRETNAMDSDVVTAADSLKRREKIQRLCTGSSQLDQLLKGGIETESITEFYAEFGSGKTQICHTLAILATLPEEQGGLNSPTVLYIDTENTFRAERIKEICEERKLDYDSISTKIYHFKVFNSAKFEYLIKSDIDRQIQEKKPRLIIVDGILSQHRSDYLGRSTLAERQQRLHSIISKLKRLAELHHLSVVVTNQVHGSPDAGIFGDPVKATGGHVVAHGTSYRIQIRKGSKTTRIAKLVDSPYHPPGEARFRLTPAGIEDIAT